MNIKSKKLLVVFAVVLIATVIAPIRSNAGLQANKGGTSLVNTTASQFFDGMRKMEIQYGTLGKNAVLDDKYLDTTNNGIDVHMALNTEWGTVALLTDSAFGVGKGISGTGNESTSTGNESGVYNLADKKGEYTATYYSNSTLYECNEKIVKSDGRYFNSYSSSMSERSGDALNCRGWLGTSYYLHINNSNSSIIYRRGNGGLFGFYYWNGESNGYFTSRAVVVCGENL